MRVAIITESFLPEINGVVNSVCKAIDHLTAGGHEVLLLAPDAPGMPDAYAGATIVGMTSMPLPGYAQVRVCATPRLSLELTLDAFRPDVVHLASPFNVGYRGAMAAQTLGLPSVAVYQTDVPTYMARYGVPGFEGLAWQRVKLVHGACTINLAPSTASIERLRTLGVRRLRRWGRGVDADLFDPGCRDDAWRASVAPAGHRIVGFMGRLAPEKQVQDLRALDGLNNTTLVVVGDGPERARLAEMLPDAVFCGQLTGTDLARAVAGFDVFVTPGEAETFGQTIQEAMASGVPVIAPASGGPLDLVDPSRTGWLYAPGDLTAMRGYVLDLLGDDAKRAAFAAAARRAIEPRTWRGVCAQLVGHYTEAIAIKREELYADAITTPEVGGGAAPSWRSWVGAGGRLL